MSTVTEPMRRDCGTCSACLSACPTGALDGSRLDARRCLAAWLQSPGSIPHWIRPRLGRRVYGCDDCLDVCPPGRMAARGAGLDPVELEFADLLSLADDQLVARFSWWFIPRRQGRYLRRNLLVAAGNSAEASAGETVLDHFRHPSSMIRGHAYWAWGRGFADPTPLRRAVETETVPEARDELMLALVMVDRPQAYGSILAADEWACTRSGVRGLGVIGLDPVRMVAVGAAGSGSTPPEVEWVDAEHRLPQVVAVHDPGGVVRGMCRQRA